jgi:hypothetical protein
MSVRTLLLVIRAIGQTTGATKKATKDMDDNEIAINQLNKTAHRFLFAGAAFLASGLVFAKTMAGVIGASRRGRNVLMRLDVAWKRFNRELSVRVLEQYGDQIESLTESLHLLSQDDAFLDNVVKVGIPLVMTIIGLGFASAIGGAWVALIGALATLISMTAATPKAGETAALAFTNQWAVLSIPLTLTLVTVVGAIARMGRLGEIDAMPEGREKGMLLAPFFAQTTEEGDSTFSNPSLILEIAEGQDTLNIDNIIVTDGGNFADFVADYFGRLYDALTEKVE